MNNKIDKVRLIICIILTLAYTFFSFFILPVINFNNYIDVLIRIIMIIPYLLLIYGCIKKSNVILGITIMSEIILIIIYIYLFNIQPTIPPKMPEITTY